MATPQFNAHSPNIKRILREHRDLVANPSNSYTASPLADDLFQWHFTLRGPPSSPYASGLYHGRIDLPPNYPFAPPSFRFLTPSGRFETNRSICLSISGHHEESWQPAWGIRTALVALRSFMESEAHGQVGGMNSTPERRTQLANESRAWICRDCGMSNDAILPEATGKEEGNETVPDDLKLQYRDQLEAEKKKAERPSADGPKDEKQPTPTSTVSRPEVQQHVPPPPQPAPFPTPADRQPQNQELARVPTQANFAPQAPHSVPAQRHPDDVEDVASAWLDNAIIGVGAMLGFMLFKKAFGIEIL